MGRRRLPSSWLAGRGAAAELSDRKPQLATALLAGGMLAALSFDETSSRCTAGQQQTLPIWFYGELFRPRNRPITNVVAVAVIAVTVIPIVLAYYLTRSAEEPA